ncbi:Small nuclear ribonucleoprotein Sm D-like protein [Porphyridium purpureum]|uniref:Small nuclear ribonucleoprotein Sm D-like protein n=1 Tax=Porphyridium purpureum TaxID=35688 RepID=A0A5J4YU44_PORPP|nr:Small nuclear ribonucleoprotein Sm D-like protein [Porphyridium purpureum]|eukprot:POR5348..scf227_4
MDDDDETHAFDESYLDFESEMFNAELALRVGRVAQRVAQGRAFQNSVALDNVAMCASVQQKPYRLLVRAPKPPSATAEEPSAASASGYAATTPETHRHDAAKRSTIEHLGAKVTAKFPPHQLLSVSVETQEPVEVLVRHTHALRGYIHGRLVAFDKHFNLVIQQAVETSMNRQQSRLLGHVLLRGEHVVRIARHAQTILPSMLNS